MQSRQIKWAYQTYIKKCFFGRDKVRLKVFKRSQNLNFLNQFTFTK